MEGTMFESDSLDVQPSSSGASSPTSSVAGSQAGNARRPVVRRRKVRKAATSLMALDERRRKGKIPAKKVGVLAAARLRKWKSKMDKKYDREIAFQLRQAQMLREEHESLRAESKDIMSRYSSLSATVRSLTMVVEFSNVLGLALNGGNGLCQEPIDQVVPDFDY